MILEYICFESTSDRVRSVCSNIHVTKFCLGEMPKILFICSEEPITDSNCMLVYSGPDLRSERLRINLLETLELQDADQAKVVVTLKNSSGTNITHRIPMNNINYLLLAAYMSKLEIKIQWGSNCCKVSPFEFVRVLQMMRDMNAQSLRCQLDHSFADWIDLSC